MARPNNRTELEDELRLRPADDYAAKMALILLEIWNDAGKTVELIEDSRKFLEQRGLTACKRRVAVQFDTAGVFQLVIPVAPASGDNLTVDEIHRLGDLSIRCCADC